MDLVVSAEACRLVFPGVDTRLQLDRPQQLLQQPQEPIALSLEHHIMKQLIHNTVRGINRQHQLVVYLLAEELPRRFVEEKIRRSVARGDWTVCMFFWLFLLYCHAYFALIV